MVNLEKILPYVHPRIVEEYKKHNYLDEFWIGAKLTERYIFEKKTKGKPRTRKINSIYRKRLGSGEEVLIYGYTLKSTDYNENRITYTDKNGKFYLPIFRSERDSGGDIITVQIEDIEPNYDVPFTREELEKIIIDIDEKTQYYIETPDRTYSIQTLDDLMNKPFADLVEFGRTGKFPPPKDDDKKGGVSSVSNKK